MAKFETTVVTNIDTLLSEVHEGILNGSSSASFEDGSDFYSDETHCAVRVYERYSLIGSNRVSLSITMFQVRGGPVSVSAIASGGSQALVFKINTVGEKNFLEKFIEILRRFELNSK